MPPAGYPALQYLQFVRVSQLQSEWRRCILRSDQFCRLADSRVLIAHAAK